MLVAPEHSWSVAGILCVLHTVYPSVAQSALVSVLFQVGKRVAWVRFPGGDAVLPFRALEITDSKAKDETHVTPHAR